MLESLGLGEATSPGRGRRRRLQHVHDPREARYAARRLPRERSGDEAASVPTSWSLWEGATQRRSASGSSTSTRSSTSRSGRARSRISGSGSRRAVIRSRAESSARTTTSPPISRSHAERHFQAWVQVSMGCNSKCAYCIVPAVRGREQSRRPGDIVAEVSRPRGRGRPRDHAARAERELVGARPCPGDPHRVRRALARVRRRRRHRADPLHEPASEGLPRACHRCDC